MPVTAPDAPPDVVMALTPINSLLAVTDILFSGVFNRFPGLQIAMSEGGVGWIPFALERADYVYQHHHRWTGADFGGKLPSQVFHEHFWTCFIDDPIGVKLREDVGVERMMWELDYPHSDSTWPTAPEILWKNLAGLPEDEINKITHQNAMRCFSFDPFQHRPRERSTVRALRSEAADIDTSIKSMGRRKAEASDRGALQAALLNVASKGSFSN
jgi:predicted TIM-barrel fold metal-dependent hydrolase